MIGWYPPLNDLSDLTWHMFMHVVVIKKKTQKYFLFFFFCWELSRV